MRRDAMITLKKILPVFLVLALIVGTMPIAFATSSLSIGSISYDSTVVKQESFMVSSSVTASNVAGTITVTVTLIDLTGGAVTITGDAEKTLTFNANGTQNVQWTVTAGTAGTYSNPFKITATASDEGIATPKTSDTPLTIQERPVLEVTFIRDKTSVSAGDTVRLDFTIMNSAAAGAADATNVVATLTLPTGWTKVTGPSPYSLGTIAAGGGSESGYWIVSADSPGSSNTLTLKVTSTLPGGTITKTVAITGPTTTTTRLPGGGPPALPPTTYAIPTDPTTAKTTSAVTATSPDGGLTLTIPENTIAKDATDAPLTSVTISLPTSIPEIPEGFSLLGYAYDMVPKGASFNPPIDLTVEYDPAKIPEGFTEADLVIKWYDEASQQWTSLPSTVDTVNHRVTAKVSHFTVFALFAEKVVPTPSPTPTATPVVTPTLTPSPSPTAPPMAAIPPWSWMLVIIAIVVVIVVVYLVRKR